MFEPWANASSPAALHSRRRLIRRAGNVNCLRALGVAPDEPVLTNAFILAPVPGAVEAVGGRAVLVEVDEDIRLDFDDLARKAEMSGARFLLLSHMRGHLCDMEQLMFLAEEFDLTVIEDCAHTMGATWNGSRLDRWNRRYGVVAAELAGSNRIAMPVRSKAEGMVGSSIQFRLPEPGEAGCRNVVARTAARGVSLNWFGDAEPVGFTSAHQSWRYMDAQQLPQTDRVHSTLFDMHFPLTFTREDCSLVGQIICEEIDEVEL